MKTNTAYNIYTQLFFIYRRIFRKAFFITLLAGCTNAAIAQKPSMNGLWTGKLQLITDANQTSLDISFNNGVVTITDHMNQKKWFNKAQMKVKDDGSSMTFTWVENNEFGVHSELYKISMLGEDSATVYWTRHCVIYGINKKYTDENWDMTGTGFIKKLPLASADELVKQ